MPISRTTIIAGPALVTYNGATFWSKGDIRVTYQIESAAIGSDIHGDVDQLKDDMVVEIAFTPWGAWENLSVLWPYGSTALGASILTGSDVPLVVHSKAGVKHTFTAAAVTQMPDLELGAAVTEPIKEVKFTAVRKNNVAETDAALFDTIASVNYPGDTGFNKTAFVTGALTIAWGSSSPWNGIKTQKGVQVRFPMTFERRKTDSDGTVDLILTSVACEATLIPIGVTEAQVLALLKMQDTGALARGASLAAGNSNDLVISRTGQVVTLKNTTPKQVAKQWGRGAETLRIGELMFSAIRGQTDGANDAIFTVATE